MILTKYAIKRKSASWAIIICLVVLGIFGYLQLSVNFLPTITYPVVKVQIRWPGSTPDEINTEIADPIERFISTVDKLDYIESSSMEGLYSLTVYFQYDADVDIAFQDVLAAMTRANSALPEDIEPPYVFKADPSQLPVMQIVIGSENWGPVKLRTWTENYLQDILLGIKGVAGTDVVGGLEREIHIRLDDETLQKYNLTTLAIIKRISEENIEQSAGSITVDGKDIITRTLGKFSSLEDLKKIVLLEKDYKKVYLEDVAKVVDYHEKADMITRLNGEESVRVSINKEAESNTVEVAQRIYKRLKDIKTSLPSGIKMNFVEDQSVYIRQSIDGVKSAAYSAAVLLVIVIFIFLGSFRQVFTMITSIPITLLINFGLMRFSGFSLNIFSLGGLVIAIGVVLDSSIVVLENISRKLKTETSDSKEQIIEKATWEVGPAIIASTISFLALFMPFFFVKGLTSLLFKELILVIAGIVVISLFMAITVTPLISSVVLKNRKDEKTSKFDTFFIKIEDLYSRLVNHMIENKIKSILFFILLFMISFSLLSKTGGEFLPLMDDGRLMIKVKMPTGTSSKTTDEVINQLEKVLKDEKSIESYFSLAGGRIKGLTTDEVANEGEINIQLVGRSKRKFSTRQYVNMLKKKVSKISYPGAKIMVKQSAIKGISGNRASDIIVKFRGQDINILQKLGKQSIEIMKSSDLLSNVVFSVDLNKPEYQIKIDREKAYELGISVKDIASTIRSYILGVIATRYEDNDEYYNVVVITPNSNFKNKEDIQNIVLSTSRGTTVRLQDVAKISLETGPIEIIRENQLKQITVEADITGKDLSSTAAMLKKQLNEKLKIPAGYELDLGGKVEMMNDMKNTVFSVLLFAIFFSFIVLVVQFNSYSIPFMILFSLPVVLSGIIPLLYLFSIPLGATVIIGILVVIAATINDGVLLITTADSMTDVGSRIERVVKAATLRLKPRIMTTMTTMVGFIPLALNLQEGSDMLQPMALAAIGGLFYELFVALLLMPILYTVFRRK